MTRIYVDTDELRDVARGLRSDASELSEINVALVREWGRNTPPPVELGWLGARSAWAQANVVALAAGIALEAAALDARAGASEAAELGAWGIAALGASLDVFGASAGLGWRAWLAWGSGGVGAPSATLHWLSQHLGGIDLATFHRSGSVALLERSRHVGDAHAGASGSVAFSKLAGEVNGSVVLGLAGLAAAGAVGARYDLVRVQGEAHEAQQFGQLRSSESAALDAAVTAHANAAGQARIGPDGGELSGGASAFAGAEVSASEKLGGSIAGVDASAGAHAGVEVGIGAGATGGVSMQAGHLHLEGDFKLAAVIGVHVGVNVDVDVSHLHVPKLHMPHITAPW